ncbi:MAG: hypothetical protein ACC657_02590 [Thiohalomonadales bacterium]
MTMLSYAYDLPLPGKNNKPLKITPYLYSDMWCKSENKQLKVEIIFPKKRTYLQPFIVQVRVPEKEKIEQIQLQFSMRGMQMMGNNFKMKRLKKVKNNEIWQAQVVLPVCLSDRKDWLVELDVKTKKNIVKSNYLITVW